MVIVVRVGVVMVVFLMLLNLMIDILWFGVCLVSCSVKYVLSVIIFLLYIMLVILGCLVCSLVIVFSFVCLLFGDG